MRTTITLLCFAASLFAAPEPNRTLFEERCNGCHALPDPSGLSEKQWDAVLKTMQQRLREAGRPVLSENELRRIRCYLNAEAGRPCS
ncbi:MAG: hypothetical protein JNJ69_00525 [Leptospiraceae bacterium]|nr:hypothetical protein [Leptospiraceae bacterium]